jgi:hypothetical protein
MALLFIISAHCEIFGADLRAIGLDIVIVLIARKSPLRKSVSEGPFADLLVRQWAPPPYPWSQA